MHHEQVLIPFQSTDLPGSSWLIFAPHPDDEVIGMGGALLKARASGCKITLVFMTSGEQAGGSSVREAEASSVAHALGAEAVFMRFPDRKVRADEVAQQKVRDLIKAHSPDTIFFPSPQEFHPYHRVTAALVWAAQKSEGYKGSLFHYEISRQSEVNHLVDISSVAERKRELLNHYVSQLSQNNYSGIMDALNTARTYTLGPDVTRAEGFFLYNSNNTELLKMLRERAFLGMNDPLPGDSPTISVLIRTKDRPELLMRSLRSVAKQNYTGQIDVVVVNDGGTPVDDIIDSFPDTFHRIIKVDVSRSRGRSASANLAMSLAEGQFLNFLDDDDELLPNHLSVFIAQWRRNRDIEVFYSGVRLVDGQGKHLKTFQEDYDRGRLLYLNFIPIHAVTFHRKFVIEGFRFDESLEYFEDWDFWIQLSRQTKFFSSGEITAVYHMIGDSAASEHMKSQIDPVYHMNAVRQKWMLKSTPNEWNASLNWVRKEAQSSKRNS